MRVELLKNLLQQVFHPLLDAALDKGGSCLCAALHKKYGVPTQHSVLPVLMLLVALRNDLQHNCIHTHIGQQDLLYIGELWQAQFLECPIVHPGRERAGGRNRLPALPVLWVAHTLCAAMRAQLYLVLVCGFVVIDQVGVEVIHCAGRWMLVAGDKLAHINLWNHGGGQRLIKRDVLCRLNEAAECETVRVGEKRAGISNLTRLWRRAASPGLFASQLACDGMEVVQFECAECLSVVQLLLVELEVFGELVHIPALVAALRHPDAT